MAKTADIIARLQLNGSQFSSESARVFGAMEAQARDSAARTKSAFETSFANIEQIAQKALSAPRSAGGSLQLDVAGARSAAAAADAQAKALREVANAAEAAALKTGATNEASRLYVQAARAAATTAEMTARGAQQEAAALDLLQAELNQTKSATDLVIQGNRLLNQSMDTVPRSARGSRQSMVQASQQFQDFFIQVGGGQSVMVAFAQQASQMAYVMQGTGGVAGRVAGIMSGPWGAAILGGVTLLGLFIPKLISSGDEAKTAGDKVAEQARKTKEADSAQKAFGETAEGAAISLAKVTEELDRQNRSLDDNVRLMQAAIEKDIGLTKTYRLRQGVNLITRRSQLAEAEAQLEPGATDAAGFAAAAAQVKLLREQVKALETSYAELGTTITGGERALRQAGFPLAERAARAAVDPIAAINLKYDQMADKAKKAATANDGLARSLAGTLTGIEQQRAGALDREQKRQSAERASERPTRKIELLAPVDGRVSSGFGMRERPTAGASTFHKGIDFAVPVGTGVRAGADGVVIKTGRNGGLGNVVWIDYGNKQIAEFNHLSEALVSKGDTVARGQMVARTGNSGVSTGAHLDYRLRVNGAYVDPRGRKVNVGNGVGDAVGDYERDAARELKRETEERERITAAIQESVTLEVEATRYQGLRLRGLQDQGEEEKRVAGIRREGMADLARLPAEQQRVTDGLDDQIARYVAQGDQLAGLLRSHGERETLSDAEKAAEEQILSAMEAQLTAALALAKTAADQLRIKEALAKVQVRLGNAEGAGDAAGREAARAQEKAAKDYEDYLEEQRDLQEDQIDELADFYERAFASGGKSIWQDFKKEGMRTLALVAAQWTISLATTGKLPQGNILGQIGAIANAGGSSGGGGVMSTFLNLLGGGGPGGGSAMPGGSYGGGVNPGGSFSLGGGMPGGGYGGVGGDAFDIGSLFGAGGGAGASAGAAAGGASALSGIISSAAAAMPIAGAVMAGSAMLTSMITDKRLGPVPGLFGVIPTLLFGKKPPVEKGSTIITGTDSESTRHSRVATGGLADSVQEGLKRVIETLGATEAAFKVSIGFREGKYVVDPTGKGDTNRPGVQSFATEAEAIKYAIMDALKDGAAAGISQASKNILAAGKDLEKSIEKAVRIEDIPKRLAALIDPVGSAIDKFDKDWAKTIAALKEGGASAAQMAEAQKLYKMELEATKASAREASATLKEFLAGINFGSASPYSLRDQEGMARTALQPFLDKIAAGEGIDQAKYSEAASAFLDIERQLYGSTGKYFEELDRIKAATGTAIGRIDAAVPVRTYVDPFVEATAGNTATANDLLSQVSGQINGTNDLLAQLLAARGGGGSDFIGGGSSGGGSGSSPTRNFTLSQPAQLLSR